MRIPISGNLPPKQQAQLNAEQQAIENQRAVDKATADAEVKRTNAEAEAQAKLIEAEAEAQANNLLERSLTEMILRQMYIEKWNGQLPNVMTGDDGALMIPAYSEPTSGQTEWAIPSE